MSTDIKIKTLASEKELSGRARAAAAMRNCPIPDNEILANAGLFLKRQELTKHLFFAELYQKHILPVHGVMMEFGVRWGQNLVTLSNLRGLLSLLIITGNLLASIHSKVFLCFPAKTVNMRLLPVAHFP